MMLPINKMMFLVLLGCLILSLQCLFEVLAGSGIGSWKWGDTETACKKEYPNDSVKMDQVNQAKRKNHQSPEPILTLEDYCHLDKKEEKSATPPSVSTKK